MVVGKMIDILQFPSSKREPFLEILSCELKGSFPQLLAACQATAKAGAKPGGMENIMRGSLGAIKFLCDAAAGALWISDRLCFFVERAVNIPLHLFELGGQLLQLIRNLILHAILTSVMFYVLFYWFTTSNRSLGSFIIPALASNFFYLLLPWNLVPFRKRKRHEIGRRTKLWKRIVSRIHCVILIVLLNLCAAAALVWGVRFSDRSAPSRSAAALTASFCYLLLPWDLMKKEQAFLRSLCRVVDFICIGIATPFLIFIKDVRRNLQEESERNRGKAGVFFLSIASSIIVHPPINVIAWPV